MKTALILAGAITLVLISMEGSASGSPPPNEAEASLMSDTLTDNEGLERRRGNRQMRSLCKNDCQCGRGICCVHSHYDYWGNCWGYCNGRLKNC